MDAWIGDAITYLMSLDGATIYTIGFAVLLLCGIGLPVPEDITLLLMGYMTYHAMPDGSPRPHAWIGTAILVGIAGVMIGDSFMFFLGRRFGDKIIGIWPFRSMFGGDRLTKARAFLQRNGPKVLFSARFMPGLRSVVFFTSGTLGIRFGTFLRYDGVAMLISVPALVGAAWYWGEQFDLVIAKARQAEHGILVLILTAGGVFLLKHWIEGRRKDHDEADLSAADAAAVGAAEADATSEPPTP